MVDSQAGNRWLPLIGGTMLNVVLGSFYAWSVFVLPLEEQFEWAREDTSTTFSIGIFTMAVTFVLAGRLHATVGFRTLAAIGGLLFSGGFFLASYTTSLAWLYITYGLIAGAGNGIGYSIAIPVVSKWFPDRRGLAIGIAVGGYGAGSGIFGPIADELLIPKPGPGMGGDLPDLRHRLPHHLDGRGVAAQAGPRRLRPRGLGPEPAQGGGDPDGARLHPVGRCCGAARSTSSSSPTSWAPSRGWG